MMLIKLGQKEHLEQFRQGQLYMNPLSYFENLEGDEARSDLYEGTDHICQPKDFRMHLDPSIPGLGTFTIDEFNWHEIAAPVRFSFERTRACNVFCMFALCNPVPGPVFAPEHQWPGDHFVMVTNVFLFSERVRTALNDQGKSYKAGLVEYYDGNSYSGDTGPLRKRSLYSYQQEYRIVLEHGSNAPFVLHVGDLSDITSVVVPSPTELIFRANRDSAFDLQQSAQQEGLA